VAIPRVALRACCTVKHFRPTTFPGGASARSHLAMPAGDRASRLRCLHAGLITSQVPRLLDRCLVEVEFYTDASTDEMRLLLTAAAECDPTDVLKLTTRTGQLLKLDSSLPANKPNNRYRLHITAAPVTGNTIQSMLRLFTTIVTVLQLESNRMPVYTSCRRSCV